VLKLNIVLYFTLAKTAASEFWQLFAMTINKIYEENTSKY